MPRKTLKRWIPHRQTFQKRRSLRWLGALLKDPNLFHLTRQSTALAVMIGVFVAFLPIVGQVPLAVLLALLLRANMPIVLITVWISNPITTPLFLLIAYKLGAWMLDTPAMDISMVLTLEWLRTEAIHIWKPLLLGGVTAGLIAGFIGYYAVYWLWRWKVVRNWERRKLARAKLLEARRLESTSASSSILNSSIRNAE